MDEQRAVHAVSVAPRVPVQPYDSHGGCEAREDQLGTPFQLFELALGSERKALQNYTGVAGTEQLWMDRTTSSAEIQSATENTICLHRG